MKDRTRLIFYFEHESHLTDKLRAELFDKGVPFLEVLDKSDLFDALESKYYNVIMQVNTQDTFDKIVKLVELYQIPFSSFIIISEINLESQSKVKTTNNVDEIMNHVMNLISSHIISMRPICPTIVQKLLSIELEKIGLTKVYIGFKYLLDLITMCMKDREKLISIPCKLSKIALYNCTNQGSVERDIRHMLTTAWKNCESYRQALFHVNKKEFVANFKNLLKLTLEHFLILI